MALEPITRQEKIIAGQDLTPITRMEKFLKQFGGGGGGGVQPDWNQNDATAADYVKNRPFYTGDPVETVLVEESTVSFADAGGLYQGQFSTTFEATVGETYKVYWDGAAYELACVDYSGYIAIGNLSIAGAGSDTGEPFLMLVNNGRGIAFYTADTSVSHTFLISGFDQEVVKIDEKYLPEHSVLYTGNPANWSDAKKQQMYDDFISGKLLLYKDYRSSNFETGVVLHVSYDKTFGLRFVLFNSNNDLISFDSDAFSETLELSEYNIGSLVKEKIDSYTRWKLYKAAASEVSVGDLLSMYVEFDSTTSKACIATQTKSEGQTVDYKNSTIVTNGDSEIMLSSSTSGSTKKFKITVDDSGTISATEVT